jgi:hypothetical protein
MPAKNSSLLFGVNALFGVVACAVLLLANAESRIPMFIVLGGIWLLSVALAVMNVERGRAGIAPFAFPIVAIILCMLLVPPSPKERHYKRPQTVNNLRSLAIAMHSYHSEYGWFPGPAICDAHGTALLSWRVALLPFLDQQQLYNQFYLNEAWDSDHNLPLLKKMPNVFAHPKRPEDAGAFKTNYLAIVGKGAAFEEGRHFRLPMIFRTARRIPSSLSKRPSRFPGRSRRTCPMRAISLCPLLAVSLSVLMLLWVTVQSGSYRRK